MLGVLSRLSDGSFLAYASSCLTSYGDHVPTFLLGTLLDYHIHAIIGDLYSCCLFHIALKMIKVINEL